MVKTWLSIKKFFRLLGPGIVTGAADDDPSGIATYSQAGAQFGYALLWTALYMLPFLLAVQEVCARIGAVTGEGLGAVVRKNYTKKLLYPIVWLVFIANTINLGADIGSMAASARLLISIKPVLLTIFFTGIILLLEIFSSYKVYAKILKWFCLFLLAYPITVFLVKQPWLVILKTTFLPQFQLKYSFFFILIAVFGTTISPYLFFWQTAQVVEEKLEKQIPNVRNKSNSSFIHRIRLDNAVGMISSEITTWSILVVTATVLHSRGVTNIETAADAAKALEPLVQSFHNSGYLAKLIFSMGIITLGFISVPILAGSSAYALAGAMQWKRSLDLKFTKAPHFYVVIILGSLIGMSLNFLGFNPMKALVYSAVINGIVATPLLILIYLIGRNRKIMGNHASGFLSQGLILLTIAGMATAFLSMLLTLKI